MTDTVNRSVFELLAIDKTKGAFDSVKNNFNESKAHILDWKTELLGALGVGGLAEMIKSAAETGEQMGRLSDRLRISTEDTYAFGKAAEMSGVSQEAMTTALEKMEKSIGQANQGTGTAKKYFEEWGISIDKITKMNAAEQFDLITSKIKAMGNEADQAAATTDIFGKSANDLQNMWGPAGHSIDEVREKMELTNASMSRFDASRVTQMNEALGDMLMVAKGVANVLAEDLAPYVKALADYFTDSAEKANGWKTEITAAVDTVMSIFGVFADGLHGISIIWTGLEVIAYGFLAVLAEVGDLLTKAILEPVAIIYHSINALIDKINQLSGLKLEKIDTSNVDGAIQTMSNLAQDAQNKVLDKEDELQKKLMEPLPSTAMEQAVTKASQQMNQLADATVAAHNKMLKQTDTEIHPTPDEIAKMKKAYDEMTKVEEDAFTKEMNTYNKSRQFILDNQDALAKAQIATKAQSNAQLEAMEKVHQDRLDKIAETGEKTRQTFMAASYKAQLNIVFGALEQMTSGVAQSNQTMFEINKVASVANAIIHTIEGVTQALAAYPPPISWAMAAVTLAAGLAQVDAIKNTTFGSGTTPSVAASGPTYNGQPTYTQTITPGAQTTGSNGPTTAAVQHNVTINNNSQIDARGASASVVPQIHQAIAASEQRVLSQVNERLARGNMPG